MDPVNMPDSLFDYIPEDEFIEDEDTLNVHPERPDLTKRNGFGELPPVKERRKRLAQLAQRLAEDGPLAEAKYGVYRKGGSIGTKNDEPLKVFDTAEEAKDYAKRMRKLLSPGERKGYGLGYITKPIKEAAQQFPEALKDDYSYAKELVDVAMQDGALSKEKFNKIYDATEYRADDMEPAEIVEELMAMRDSLEVQGTAVRFQAYYDMLLLKSAYNESHDTSKQEASRLAEAYSDDQLYSVTIRHNFHRSGSTYDNTGRRLKPPVLARSEEDAMDIVRQHKDEIEKRLRQERTRNGRLLIMKSDKYRFGDDDVVRAELISRANREWYDVNNVEVLTRDGFQIINVREYLAEARQHKEAYSARNFHFSDPDEQAAAEAEQDAWASGDYSYGSEEVEFSPWDEYDEPADVTPGDMGLYEKVGRIKDSKEKPFITDIVDYVPFPTLEELESDLQQGMISPDELQDIFCLTYDVPEDLATMYINSIESDFAPLEESKMEESSLSPRQRKLQEAARDRVLPFLKKNDDGTRSISALYRDYLAWVGDSEKPVGDVTFRSVANAFRQQTSEDTPDIAVEDDLDDSAEYDEFEQEILNGQVLLKYEMIEEVIRGIVTWSPYQSNAFIYGTGGVGKTHAVMKSVSRFANEGEVEVYKGAISGFTGLLQVLWENRKGKIIIFDDNDGLLVGSQQNAINILKGAMDSSEPRIIRYTRFKRRGETGLQIDASRITEKVVSVYEDDELLFEENVSAEDASWIAKRAGVSFKERSALFPGEHIMEASLADTLSDEDVDAADEFDDGEEDGGRVPDKFQFSSRIIFISNLLKVPQPLMDRCVLIGVILTKQQILDRIETILDDLLAELPEVTLQTKKFTLEFMRKYRHRIGKPLTFRMFEQVAKMFQDLGTDKRAQQMAYLSMRGEGQAVVLGK